MNQTTGKWVGWHHTKGGWVAVSSGESHKEATEGLRRAGVPLCKAAIMLRGAHPEDVDYLSDCSTRLSRRGKEERLQKAKGLLPFLGVPISVRDLAKAARSTTAQVKPMLGFLQRAGLVVRQKVGSSILWVAGSGIETPEPKRWPPGLQLNLFGEPFYPPFKRRRRRRLCHL